MHHVDREWNPRETAGLTRRDRSPGVYRALVPDELGLALPPLGREAAGAAEDALTVLARADERIGARGSSLNHLLIRSESISSSWIEGNRVTPKKLAIAEVLQQGKKVALDVIANVRATETAIAGLADRERRITLADIEALQHTIEPSLPYGVREEQNWMGGTGWSPLRADFVPPPESEVRRLVEDLAAFVTATEGNPVVRAALAHAQFETIHPFIDGNGRTGRALIHTVLKRSDALRNVLVPISTVFAGDKDEYIAGLTAFRAGEVDDWVIGFARATEVAASNAVALSEAVERLDSAVLERLVAYRAEAGLSPARPRKDAVVLRILDRLAIDPVLTAETAARNHGVSTVAAHGALAQLSAAGILSRNKDHKGRLFCWTADEHLAHVALTERSNRIGGGDTINEAPRHGPARPDTRVVGRLLR
ncbi:Fic family protein [Rathayibacter caricis]|uniref:Fic family protein n=1 Tax=Rathayibacter caricis TaxID=110936 RepID=UPI001FB1C9A5|nr:Fic family protein [Rathayibacter caricis]MCJ1697148.1 Fic family protein [Rathayibacter caricis]